MLQVGDTVTHSTLHADIHAASCAYISRVIAAVLWCAGFPEIWHTNFVQTMSTLAVLRQNAAATSLLSNTPTNGTTSASTSPSEVSTQPVDVAACWQLVASNVDQMQVWCTACSDNFQAQLALYEAEIAYTKLDERVQADDPTLTEDEHESTVRAINQLYRDAFRHVTHALPRRLRSKRQASVDNAQPREHSINVSHRSTRPHPRIVALPSALIARPKLMTRCCCALYSVSRRCCYQYWLRALVDEAFCRFTFASSQFELFTPLLMETLFAYHEFGAHAKVSQMQHEFKSHLAGKARLLDSLHTAGRAGSSAAVSWQDSDRRSAEQPLDSSRSTAGVVESPHSNASSDSSSSRSNSSLSSSSAQSTSSTSHTTPIAAQSSGGAIGVGPPLAPLRQTSSSSSPTATATSPSSVVNDAFSLLAQELLDDNSAAEDGIAPFHQASQSGRTSTFADFDLRTVIKSHAGHHARGESEQAAIHTAQHRAEVVWSSARYSVHYGRQ